MEQSENSIEISSRVLPSEQIAAPVFRDAERLRKESIAFWQTSPLTIQSLSDKIVREKSFLSEKYIVSYAALQNAIGTLKKEKINQQELNNRLFALLKKQDPYMLESILESLLFQGDTLNATMENMPYFMYRYIKGGAREYIASGDTPKLHGVLLQRLLVTGFLDIDEKTFSRKMTEMVEGTYLLFSLLREKKYPYTKRNAYGVYMRHLSGAFRSAFSMIESARYLQNIINKPVQYSVPFDHWDNGYKADGVLFSKESGKVIGLIQSKPARVVLREKDHEVRVQEVQAEYRHQSYQKSGSTYTADFWTFPMGLFSADEAVKEEDIHAKEQYKKDINKFINGSLLLNFIENQSFEENWWSIFYTSRIQLPSYAKEMSEFIHYRKELIDQSL